VSRSAGWRAWLALSTLHRAREVFAFAGHARRAANPGAQTKRESRDFLRLVTRASSARVQERRDSIDGPPAGVHAQQITAVDLEPRAPFIDRQTV
jgi:hypothetical protein